MEIKLRVFCEDDLDVQCDRIIDMLHQGKSIKEIKKVIER